jgi:hypothetical protein
MEEVFDPSFVADEPEPLSIREASYRPGIPVSSDKQTPREHPWALHKL